MKLRQRIADNFKRNLLVWILVGALAVVAFWNYQKGAQLSRVCELIGPFGVTVGHPQTPREELAAICGGYQGE